MSHLPFPRRTYPDALGLTDNELITLLPDPTDESLKGIAAPILEKLRQQEEPFDQVRGQRWHAPSLTFVVVQVLTYVLLIHSLNPVDESKSDGHYVRLSVTR